MGIYFSTRYERIGNKKYLVMRRNRRSFIVLLALLLLCLATFLAPVFVDSLLGIIEYPFSFWVASSYFTLALFILAGILLGIEQLKPLIARIKGKEVSVKGALTVFNTKNPAEVWIEQ